MASQDEVPAAGEPEAPRKLAISAPVVPSSTSNTSCGAPSICRLTTRWIFSSSRIRCVWVWRRPAVSTMRISVSRARARSQASCATLAGSAPGAPRTMSAPERVAQIVHRLVGMLTALIR